MLGHRTRFRRIAFRRLPRSATWRRPNEKTRGLPRGVRVRLRQAGVGDAHELGLGMELGDRECIGVAHRTADAGKQFRVSLKIKMDGRTQVDLGGMDFNTNRRRQRVIMAIVGFPVPIESPCDLRFEVYLDDNYKASHLISATVAESPPEQTVKSSGLHS